MRRTGRMIIIGVCTAAALSIGFAVKTGVIPKGFQSQTFAQTQPNGPSGFQVSDFGFQDNAASEISGVRIGTKSPDPEPISRQLARSPGVKLAAMAIEVDASFIRPEALPKNGPVQGMFTLEPPRQARSSDQNVVVASVEPATAPITSRPLAPINPPIGIIAALSLPQAALFVLPSRMTANSWIAPGTTGFSQLDQSPFGLACDRDITTTVREDAIVEITISDPCQPNARLDVIAGKLTFSIQASHTGEISMSIPVMTDKPLINLMFQDGSQKTIRPSVPGLYGIDRVAVQWQGAYDLRLHALEFGGQIGSSRDVWAGQNRWSAQSRRIGGGYLISLGSPDLENPRVVEVYTLRRTQNTPLGLIEMVVEALANPQNCGGEAALESIRSKDGQIVATSQFNFALPDCENLTSRNLIPSAVRDIRLSLN